LALLAFWLPLCGASAQVEKVTKPPQLKLEIAPSKRTHTIEEAVLVRYKLTSLVDGTLCFPLPAIETRGSFQGYLTLEARPRNPVDERDIFIDYVWPRHPDEEELRKSISREWIKLGMLEPYLVPKADKMIVVNELGDWTLVAGVSPA
jgi:hypothetical protein